MITRTRPRRYVSGFCQSGNHQLCPGATRNGNGSILECRCGGCAHEHYCLDCRTPLDATWQCDNRRDCRSRVISARNATALHAELDACRNGKRFRRSTKQKAW